MPATTNVLEKLTFILCLVDHCQGLLPKSSASITYTIIKYPLFITHKFITFHSRCPTDNTVQFHKTQNHRQRFSIQAFKFLNNSTSVYFHCLVFLCHSTSTDYRCRYGCTGNNIFRGKRDLSGVSKDHPSQYYMVEREVRRVADSSQGKHQVDIFPYQKVTQA